MDISQFGNPVRFTVPQIGTVLVSARKVQFLVWVEKRMSSARWTDGGTLMADVLREQAHTETGERLAKAAVAALAQEDIEAAAGAFLDAADPVMGPFSAEAGLDPDLQPGEAQTDRLRRILFARVRRFSASMARATDEILRPVRELQRAMGPAHEMIRQQREFDRIFRHSSIIEQTTALAASGLFSQAMQDARHTSWAHLAKVAGIGSAMASIHEGLRRTVDNAGLGSVGAQLFAHPALAMPTWLDSSVFTDQLALTKLLRSQFDLRLPVLALASLGALHSAQLTSAQRLPEPLLRPGFQTVAVAGLDGVAARGAVADVLAHYGDDRDREAPIFGAVVQGVRSLDAADSEAIDAQLRAVLDELPDLIADALRRDSRRITWNGIIALISLLLSIAALGYDKQSYDADQADRKRPGTEVLIAKIDELKPKHIADAGARRATRYVHDRALLRGGPSREATVIRYIYPDQTVIVLEASEAWAKVEVYDYASDRPAIGWISRRMLRIGPLQ